MVAGYHALLTARDDFMNHTSDAMQGKVLVCGSLAIDQIGRYDGSFQTYQDRFPVRSLNISLQLANLHHTFGGCGMNITYGLTLLGVDCVPLTAAGLDFHDHYEAHLKALGVCLDYIIVDSDYASCASCILLSDDDGNQITAFHSGAAVSAKRPLPSQMDCIDKVSLAILAPEDAAIMLRQARDLNAAGIPILFDPGQGLAEFGREEVCELLELSDVVLVNSHEFDILLTTSGYNQETLIQSMRSTIVTRGRKGVEVFLPDEHLMIASAPVSEFVDTTGCGDAFRAGYIYGMTRGYDAAVCAQFGNLMAAENITSHEPQRYRVTEEALLARHKEVYPVS